MTNCESCGQYVYDEEYDCYVCMANLDEDEMGRFLQNAYDNCPHYQSGDEYKTVRKQI